MVEFILSDAQLDRLKAAVTIGSEESSVPMEAAGQR
jgi:hypothetical protein